MNGEEEREGMLGRGRVNGGEREKGEGRREGEWWGGKGVKVGDGW